MATEEEYRALLEDARDALCALLEETDLALPSPTLRGAYRICRDALQKDDTKATIDDEKAARKREERAIWDRWKNTPRHERWRAILDALGDDGRPVGDLADKLDAARDDWRVHTGDVQAELYRMIEAGEVAREKRPWRHEQTRWHYFRRSHLEGDIVDLERAFHDDEQEA